MVNARDQLRDLMSDISEDCWFAGWLIGLEYSLWEMVQGGDRKFGIGAVQEIDIDEMRRLSEEIDGWLAWSESEMEVAFVPMVEWLAMYAEVSREATNG